MEIMDIIKESFVFPSKDLAKLAIYIAITFAVAILAILGIVFLALGLADSIIYAVIGIIIFIAAFLVCFVISGYQISIIKSGIVGEESAPEWAWQENLVTGIKYWIVTIVYYIVPAIIVLIVAWATNLFGLTSSILTKLAYASMDMPANATMVVGNVIPESMLASFGIALSITGIVALVLFLVFMFLQTMAVSRLANTESLGEALNIPEAFRDIGRIGWGKVIAVIVLVFVIIFVINAVISGLNYYINGISIVSIVVTPYLLFFSCRASGLLYSDIA